MGILDIGRFTRSRPDRAPAHRNAMRTRHDAAGFASRRRVSARRVHLGADPIETEAPESVILADVAALAIADRSRAVTDKRRERAPETVERYRVNRKGLQLRSVNALGARARETARIAARMVALVAERPDDSRLAKHAKLASRVAKRDAKRYRRAMRRASEAREEPLPVPVDVPADAVAVLASRADEAHADVSRAPANGTAPGARAKDCRGARYGATTVHVDGTDGTDRVRSSVEAGSSLGRLAMSTGARSAVTGDTGNGSRNVGRQRNAPRPTSSAGDHGAARPASSVPVYSGPVRTSMPTGPATTRDRVDVRASDFSFTTSARNASEAPAWGSRSPDRVAWLRWLRSPTRLYAWARRQRSDLS